LIYAVGNSHDDIIVIDDSEESSDIMEVEVEQENEMELIFEDDELEMIYEEEMDEEEEEIEENEEGEVSNSVHCPVPCVKIVFSKKKS